MDLMLCLITISILYSTPSILSRIWLFLAFTWALPENTDTQVDGILLSPLLNTRFLNISNSSSSACPVLIFSRRFEYSKSRPCLWFVLNKIGWKRFQRGLNAWAFLCFSSYGSFHGNFALIGWSCSGSPKMRTHTPPNGLDQFSFSSLIKIYY